MDALGQTELRSDERVMFFPTLGWKRGGAWHLEIHGWVYEPETRPLIEATLRHALGLSDDELTEKGKAVFSERARFFLVDNERRKRVSIELAGNVYRLARSEANGHFTEKLELAGMLLTRMVETNRIASFRPAESMEPAPIGEVHLLEDHGLSVISDIDDTIKISQVRDRDALVKNTFVRPFQPIPEMAALYQSWAGKFGAQFHYVSASPWQLYPALAGFTRSNGFPAGTFHLKQFRVKDESFFDLFASPERYKPGVIEPMLRRFPNRRFVLVGDSGEKDPEIYGAIARKFPRQIAAILIRNVTAEEPASVRYRNAFRGLPAEQWAIFKDPSKMLNWSLPR